MKRTMRCLHCRIKIMDEIIGIDLNLNVENSWGIFHVIEAKDDGQSNGRC